MKRMVLILMLLGMTWGNLYAKEGILIKSFTVATYYDFNTDDLLAGISKTVYEWDKLLYLDIGIITDANRGTLSLGFSVDLKEVASRIGAKYRPLDPIKIGFYSARNFDKRNWYYGFYIGTDIIFGK